MLWTPSIHIPTHPPLLPLKIVIIYLNQKFILQLVSKIQIYNTDQILTCMIKCNNLIKHPTRQTNFQCETTVRVLSSHIALVSPCHLLMLQLIYIFSLLPSTSPKLHHQNGAEPSAPASNSASELAWWPPTALTTLPPSTKMAGVSPSASPLSQPP